MRSSIAVSRNTRASQSRARLANAILGDVSSRSNAGDVVAPKRAIRTSTTIARKPAPKLTRLGDEHDPHDVYDFDLEIYKVMKDSECERVVDADYFSHQSTIRPKVRTSIINWMVEVHKKLKMHTDTLFTAVELMDLFLSRVDFDRTKLQVLCCTTLLIAAKSEEIYPPAIDDLVYISKDSFTAKDIKEVEMLVLNTLDFRVNPVHSSYFMKRFLRLTNGDTYLTMLAHFINENALLSDKLIGVLPSKRAAAVVYLALVLTEGESAWSKTMSRNTGYSRSELREIANSLLEAIHTYNESRHQAIHRKYAAEALCSVSEMDFPSEL